MPLCPTAIMETTCNCNGISSSVCTYSPEGIRSQRFSSLLLPPVVPYPAEWILARAYLKAGKFRECADLCEQALKRFPNHAGVLETLDKARSSGK